MWPQAGVNGNLLTMTINESLAWLSSNGELSYRYPYFRWANGGARDLFFEFPNYIIVVKNDVNIREHLQLNSLKNVGMKKNERVKIIPIQNVMVCRKKKGQPFSCSLEIPGFSIVTQSHLTSSKQNSTGLAKPIRLAWNWVVLPEIYHSLSKHDH